MNTTTAMIKSGAMARGAKDAIRSIAIAKGFDIVREGTFHPRACHEWRSSTANTPDGTKR
jgi:hypothetical protein